QVRLARAIPEHLARLVDRHGFQVSAADRVPDPIGGDHHLGPGAAGRMAPHLCHRDQHGRATFRSALTERRHPLHGWCWALPLTGGGEPAATESSGSATGHSRGAGVWCPLCGPVPTTALGRTPSTSAAGIPSCIPVPAPSPDPPPSPACSS